MKTIKVVYGRKNAKAHRGTQGAQACTYGEVSPIFLSQKIVKDTMLGLMKWHNGHLIFGVKYRYNDIFGSSRGAPDLN